VTGHSLGGALAILAAYDLVDQHIATRPLVYTFGQPRTGNYAFATSVMATVPDVYRLTHYRDIVAHLPPCNTTFDILRLASVCTAGNPDKGTCVNSTPCVSFGTC
jgi:predicted lipase